MSATNLGNLSDTNRSFQHKNDSTSTDTLFRTLLSNPTKRALILQLLSLDETIQLPTDSQPSSVTSLRNNKQVDCSIDSNGVLKNVISYVELHGRDGSDRSAGAKSLMRSLGATVRETFTTDVTHVIFKGGTFDTYLKAKQNNVHLVSVLWLEAVRNNNVHVSENEYPALGTSSYDVNITNMYKDYEELIQDERLLASSQKPNVNKKSVMQTQICSPYSSDSFTTPECLPEGMNQSGSDCDLVTIISNDSAVLPSPQGFEVFHNSSRLSISSPELTSDNDSECGVINGRSAKEKRNFEHSKSASSISEQKLTNRELSNTSSQSVSLLATNVKKNVNNCNEKENMGDAQRDTTKLDKHKKKVKKGKTLTQKLPTTFKAQRKCKSTNVSKVNSDHVNDKSRGLLSNISPNHSNSNSFTRRTRSGRFNVLQDSSASLNSSVSSILRNSKGNSHNTTNDDSYIQLEKSKPPSLGSSKKHKADLGSSLANTVSNESKRTSGSDYMPSLRVSRESTHQVNGQNLTPSVLIDRLSRIAIRGSDSAVDKSIQGFHVTRSLSANNSNNSFQSTSSTSSFKRAHQNARNAISTLMSEDSENDMDLSLQRPQNLIELPKRNMRKLYDPKQSIDEAHKMWVEEENRKAFNNPNKQLVVSLVPVAPILLTAKAKKLLKYLGRKKQTNSEKIGLNTPTQKAKEKVNKKKGIKMKNKKNNALINTENDEQTELIGEIVNKDKRKSLRILQHSSQSTSKRRSTLDFVSTPRIRPCLLFNKNKQKIKPRIVCTRFHKPDVLLFMQIVKKLGTFVVEDEVSRKTTHLVVGESGRTINLLRAIARGCWILKQEWLLRSLEEGEWLDEEDYELTEFSPAVQQCRLHRQAFGGMYSMDIFENCGPIYIVRSSNPRRSDLEELVLLCKGKISNTAMNASIVVGEWVRYDVVCVSEQWILDSISCNKRKSYRKYLLQ